MEDVEFLPKEENNEEIKAKDIPRKWHQLLGTVAGSLGAAAVGHCFCMSSFILPQLEDPEVDDIHLDTEAGSWFASTLTIGGFTGAFFGGIQSHFLGRRRGMMIDMLICIVGLTFIVFSGDLLTLLVGRFLSGHAVMSSAVTVPIYVGEISHHRIRGAAGNVPNVFFMGGFTWQLFLGATMPWRLAVACAILPPVLSFILLAFCPESPRWLLRQGRKPEAVTALMFYRGDEATVSEELKAMEDHFPEEEESKPRRSIHSLCTMSFIKPFTLLFAMLCVGMNWSGFPAIAFYMVTIFKDVGVPMDEYFASVLVSLYRFFICLLITVAFLRASKRKIYLMSACIVVVATAGFGTCDYLKEHHNAVYASYFSWVPLLAVMLMYTGFACGYGTIVFILQGEILPAQSRGIGSGLLGCCDCLSLFLAIKLLPWLTETLHLYGTFWMFSAVATAVTAYVALVMPETTGLTLEEIERKYSKK